MNIIDKIKHQYWLLTDKFYKIATETTWVRNVSEYTDIEERKYFRSNVNSEINCAIIIYDYNKSSPMYNNINYVSPLDDPKNLLHYVENDRRIVISSYPGLIDYSTLSTRARLRRSQTKFILKNFNNFITTQQDLLNKRKSKLSKI